MPPHQIIRFDQPVGSGVTGAMWASVRAVLKQNTRDDPYCVANELICGQLGQFLGLPIPPCGLFLDPRNPIDRPWFGTLNFNIRGDSLPPADPDECVSAYSNPAYPRPDVVTGLVLFDAWVANGDRHQRNLALDTTVTPAQLHVFDHSWTLFGREGMTRLNRLSDDLGLAESSSASGNRHCLLDAIRSNVRFRYWLERLERLPNYVIDDVVLGAYRSRLVTDSEATAVGNFLKYRRDHLSNIIQVHRNEFTAIPPAMWVDL